MLVEHSVDVEEGPFGSSSGSESFPLDPMVSPLLESASHAAISLVNPFVVVELNSNELNIRVAYNYTLSVTTENEGYPVEFYTGFATYTE